MRQRMLAARKKVGSLKATDEPTVSADRESSSEALQKDDVGAAEEPIVKSEEEKKKENLATAEAAAAAEAEAATKAKAAAEAKAVAEAKAKAEAEVSRVLEVSHHFKRVLSMLRCYTRSSSSKYDLITLALTLLRLNERNSKGKLQR